MISPRDFTENERTEEFDFQVLARKVYCKFTIQTKSTCYLMQIEKQALVEMIDLFQEIFVDWVSKEFIALYQIQKRKKKFIQKCNELAANNDGNMPMTFAGDGLNKPS